MVSDPIPDPGVRVCLVLQSHGAQGCCVCIGGVGGNYVIPHRIEEKVLDTIYV